MKKIFIFAGEASGDLHGSHLISQLSKDFKIEGVGGPRMRKEPFECLIPMEKFQSMGLIDVLKSLPRLFQLFNKVKHLILKKQPACLILIDYPGFNLRLARHLRKKGYKGKIVQYICPTVWAHGKERIDVLDQYFDLLLTVYPFEASLFENKKIQVQYTGNPLAESIHTHAYQSDWREKIGIPVREPFIALFPGSRPGEISKNLCIQLNVAAELKKRHPSLLFALSCGQDGLHEQIMKIANKNPLQLNQDLFIVPSTHHYNLMKDCTTALAKSGTVTLELALHHVPTIVQYELPGINYLFAKYWLKLDLPHYCMVNILKNQTLFPEFIGKNINQDTIVNALEKLHFDALERARVVQGCQELTEELCVENPYAKAAEAIKNLIMDKQI